jgi:D-alanyl-D-alanine carboxypeptidase
MNNSQTLTPAVAGIHQTLGIAAGYASTTGLVPVPECTRLLSAGPDVFGRDALVDGEALSAWQRMQQAAAADGITLQLVSAFRSIDYQKGIFERKLLSGQAIEAILNVNAAPGFSEHHSGCALDLGTPDFPHLETAFERSPAFQWLQVNAGRFGFSLSFPRNNPHGVLYEPWHWRYHKQQQG